MQLWFAHTSEVTLREQLVTQVILAILSGDLTPGQRLPSTRELARRFRLHPNTVSAGYRELESQGWLEHRHGSGVYVRRRKPDDALTPLLAFDQLVANLFRETQKLGFTLPTVRARLRHWLELQAPDHFLLIEPEDELRSIVHLEMQQAVSFPVQSCGLDDCHLEGAIPVALPNRSDKVRKLLPPGVELLVLQVRSVPSSLAGWLPAPSAALLGVASRWQDFLKLARTMLVAAGFYPDSLILCDARKSGWQRGLKQTAAVVCDSLTAAHLPKTLRAITFPLLSETSTAELKHYQDFISRPLDVL